MFPYFFKSNIILESNFYPKFAHEWFEHSSHFYPRLSVSLYFQKLFRNVRKLSFQSEIPRNKKDASHLFFSFIFFLFFALSDLKKKKIGNYIYHRTKNIVYFGSFLGTVHGNGIRTRSFRGNVEEHCQSIRRNNVDEGTLMGSIRSREWCKRI